MWLSEVVYKKKKKEKKSHVDKATEGNNTDKALSVLPAHSTTLLHPGPPFASSPQGSTNFNFTPTLSSCPPASHWTAWRFVFSFISFLNNSLQQREKREKETKLTRLLYFSLFQPCLTLGTHPIFVNWHTHRRESRLTVAPSILC